ncbi:hypothetical protein M0R36_03030 [bacterium]|jgi:hypothetical protein|nr:hypothetical protein [bacterium]
MDKTLLIVLIDKRKESAVTAQKILTEWGCMIKTRLGIHDGLLDDCSNSGLIILELVGQKQKKDELARKLNLLEGVQAKMVELSLKDK